MHPNNPALTLDNKQPSSTLAMACRHLHCQPTISIASLPYPLLANHVHCQPTIFNTHTQTHTQTHTHRYTHTSLLANHIQPYVVANHINNCFLIIFKCGSRSTIKTFLISKNFLSLDYQMYISEYLQNFSSFRHLLFCQI